MRIAVDARELCGRPTGVGRYLSELLQEWATSPDARRHEWQLYAHDTPAVPTAYTDKVRVIPGAGGTRWEQIAFARALAADRPDVLFAPGYTAPLTAPCPVALTVHDVSFAAHPEWFSAREGFRRRVMTRWSARRARMVLTVSHFSRTEITRFLGIPEKRIRVIAHGMRPLPPADTSSPPSPSSAASAAPARSAASVAREPMVLYVGSLFTRRNVLSLMRAFLSEVLPAVPGATLVLVGENRMHPPYEFRELTHGPAEWRSAVSLRSYVSDQELQRLYGAASVFAFLSAYEGFGLTPLEALAAGVAPLVLDTPVAREIYGPAAGYVPQSELIVPDLGAALVDLLTREQARADILKHAPEVLARYRWDRAAAETLRALEETAGA